MIHVSTGLDPILGVSETFDLLLPSLLRLAPALHPCNEDEVFYSGKQQRPDDNLNLNGSDSLADQLLMANSNEVEETLSRLMLLASMSPVPAAAVAALGGKTALIQPPVEHEITNATMLDDAGFEVQMDDDKNSSLINDCITSTSSSSSAHLTKQSSASDLAVLAPPPGLLGPSSGRPSSTTASSLI